MINAFAGWLQGERDLQPGTDQCDAGNATRTPVNAHDERAEGVSHNIMGTGTSIIR